MRTLAHCTGFACLVVAAAAGLSLAAAWASAPTPGDVVMNQHSSANGMPAVVFPHWAHRQEFRCYACHPKPFAMQQVTELLSALATGAQSN